MDSFERKTLPVSLCEEEMRHRRINISNILVTHLIASRRFALRAIEILNAGHWNRIGLKTYYYHHDHECRLK